MAGGKCPRCGKDFVYPSRLKKHLARATPCFPPDEEPVEQKRIHQCKDCLKTFAHRQGLSYHRHNTCSHRAAIAEPTELELLKAQLEAQALKLKQLEIASSQHQSSTLTSTNTNSHNTLQSEVVNGPKIIINSFGEEDFSNMIQEVGDMLDSLPAGTPGHGVISGALGLMYSNSKRPQNKTVRITNKRDNTPSIKVGDQWEKKSESFLYPLMVKAACEFLEKNQDWTLGDRMDTRPLLAYRSAHVRSAFDCEAEMMKDEKMQAHAIRPLLYT